MKSLLLLIVSVPLYAQTQMQASTFTGTIGSNAVAQPTTSNSGGSCSGSDGAGWSCTGTTTVSFADATAGSTICYTNDGSTPTAPTAGTCSGGTTQTYSTGISTASTTTYKLLGTKSGLSNSSTLTVVYTISGGTGTYTFVNSAFGGGSAADSVATTSAVDCTGGGGANVGFIHAVTYTGLSVPTPHNVGDSQSNTYTQIGSIASVTTTSRWFMASTFSAGASMTFHAQADYISIEAFCFNRSPSGSTFDTSNTNVSCFNCTLPSTTPAQGGELALTGGSTENAGISLTVPSGYTGLIGAIVSSGNYFGSYASYKIKSSGDTSAEAPTWTGSTTGVATIILVK